MRLCIRAFFPLGVIKSLVHQLFNKVCFSKAFCSPLFFMAESKVHLHLLCLLSLFSMAIRKPVPCSPNPFCGWYISWWIFRSCGGQKRDTGMLKTSMEFAKNCCLETFLPFLTCSFIFYRITQVNDTAASAGILFRKGGLQTHRVQNELNFNEKISCN